MIAVYQNKSTTILKLLSKIQGVDWNSRNNNGKSLLDVAVEKGHKLVEKFLRKKISQIQTEAEDTKDAFSPRNPPWDFIKSTDTSSIADLAVNLGAELQKMNSQLVEMKTEIDKLEEEKKKI